MPESPRWLYNKDRHSGALAVFARWHDEGDENKSFVQIEYAEARAAIAFDKQQNCTNWSDSLKTKGNRERITIIIFICFFSQWSGNGLISYHLNYIMDNVRLTDASAQLSLNGGMKTLALGENFLFALLVDKLGRRPMYLVSTMGTFAMFNISTIMSARYDAEPQAPLGKGFIASIRYYIYYCVFHAFEIGVIYFCIVETRYTPIEEIAKFFDGDDSVDVGEVALADAKEDGIAGKGIAVRFVKS